MALPYECVQKTEWQTEQSDLALHCLPIRKRRYITVICNVAYYDLPYFNQFWHQISECLDIFAESGSTRPLSILDPESTQPGQGGLFYLANCECTLCMSIMLKCVIIFTIKLICHRWTSEQISDKYSYSIMSENIINFILCTMIYLSYVNLTIQLSQFDEYPT